MPRKGSPEYPHDPEPWHAEDAFRLLVESVADYAIFLLSTEGNVLTWNPGAQRMKGYLPHEIIGKHFSAFYPENEIVSGKPAAVLEVARREGKYREEGWRVRKDGTVFYADVMITALFDERRQLRGFGKVTRDITERRRAEQHQRLLLDELNHRVKNTLATVQSMARQTLQGDISLEAFREAFEGRLMALSQTHNLLTVSNWQGASLSDIAHRELAPYSRTDRPNVRFDGPDIYLRPKHAVALGMALHELATNAAKYGALSHAAGWVNLEWRINDRLLRLEWAEHHGPPVRPPRRRGFGSRLLERGLAHELAAQTQLDFAPEGLRCHIELMLPKGPEGKGP